VSQGLNLSAPDKVILFLAPLIGEVAVKEMSPTNERLFLNKFMIARRESSRVDSDSFEPAIESCDQYIQEVMIRRIRVMGFA
jgi:hypothetical protein